jgi:alkanesulfonate monooxygenase SsuD/methylene tetrahydromethanopterin reductase-like flavin-dependent oxidoreductase (luciferase family)
MRFGVVMLPTDPWPETVERARRLEQLGYDHIWTYDHLSWRRYRGRPWFNAVPWLTGLAAVTTRVELGTMVASPNFRNPVTLAQEAVTIDHVSNGRFVLGIGAGGVGFDSSVFGHATLTPAQLVARLDEFVDVLGRLFSDDVVSYAGDYYTVDEAVVQPSSVRTPHVPIAVAASGPKSISLVARRADAWITLGDVRPLGERPADRYELVRTHTRLLDDACTAAGRDPSTVRRIFMTGVTEDRPLASVSAFQDFAGALAELGFTDVVFHHPRSDDPVWDEPESIVEEIATTVIPRMR